MITVPEATEKIIKRSRYLSEAISKGIINTSSLARYIKPEVEQMTFKKVSKASVVMALKRLENKLNKPHRRPLSTLSLNDISIKSNISECVVKNTQSLPPKIEEILSLDKEGERLLTLSVGKHQTSIIFSNDLKRDVERILLKEEILYKRTSLAAITVKLPKETLDTPGVFYSILKSFAWENINTIDIFSTYLDFTIVIDDKNLEVAFSVVQSIFLSEKKILYAASQSITTP